MKMIQPQQMRTMYAMAHSLGMDNDDLHTLVQGQTGLTSIKALGYDQAATVVVELAKRMELAGVQAPRKKSKRKRPETPGGVTSEQQAKAWALMYQLEKFDPARGGASVGDRLRGMIKKQFGMDAPPAQPFRFLKMEQGRELIETLKQMATTAEKKALRQGGVAHG